MNKKKLTEETVQRGRKSRGGTFWIRTPRYRRMKEELLFLGLMWLEFRVCISVLKSISGMREDNPLFSLPGEILRCHNEMV